MTPNRVSAQIDAISKMAHNLTEQRRGALAALRLRVEGCDGYPSTASGADKPPGGHGTSSVESAALRRLGEEDDRRRAGPVTDLEDASDFLAAAALALDNVSRIFGRYITGLTDSERQALRCIGDGTPDGATCERWATRKGMCDAHYMASRRRDERVT